MNGVIRVIAVNPAETLVAVGFSTGAISLIESRTGTLVASWKGGDTEIASVSSSEKEKKSGLVLIQSMI